MQCDIFSGHIVSEVLSAHILKVILLRSPHLLPNLLPNQPLLRFSCNVNLLLVDYSVLFAQRLPRRLEVLLIRDRSLRRVVPVPR